MSISADWSRLLAVELSLGIKSEAGRLLVHRQNEPCVADLFRAIAKMYSSYSDTCVSDKCDDFNFQSDCDDIFDEVGPMVWKGPSSWLIQASDKRYGVDTSADCYWKKMSSSKKDLLRRSFHELVAHYLTYANVDRANRILSITCDGGPRVILGRLLKAPPEFPPTQPPSSLQVRTATSRLQHTDRISREQQVAADAKAQLPETHTRLFHGGLVGVNSMAAAEPSAFDHILGTELALGFKSSEDKLIAQRQDIPAFKELFEQIVKLYPDYVGHTVAEICEDNTFQPRCDEIFEELGEQLWQGFAASWLIKATDAEYKEGISSCGVFWDTPTFRREKEGFRYHFHELVALYVANAEPIEDATVLAIRCDNGQMVPLGRLDPASSANATRKRKRRQSEHFDGSSPDRETQGSRKSNGRSDRASGGQELTSIPSNAPQPKSQRRAPQPSAKRTIEAGRTTQNASRKRRAPQPDVSPGVASPSVGLGQAPALAGTNPSSNEARRPEIVSTAEDQDLYNATPPRELPGTGQVLFPATLPAQPCPWLVPGQPNTDQAGPHTMNAPLPSTTAFKTFDPSERSRKQAERTKKGTRGYTLKDGKSLNERGSKADGSTRSPGMRRESPTAGMSDSTNGAGDQVPAQDERTTERSSVTDSAGGTSPAFMTTYGDVGSTSQTYVNDDFIEDTDGLFSAAGPAVAGDSERPQTQLQDGSVQGDDLETRPIQQDYDRRESEVTIKQEPKTGSGNYATDPISLLSDDEDGDSVTHQSIKSEAPQARSRPRIQSQPKRARVLWGPLERYESVIRLEDILRCSGGLEFTGDIESLKNSSPLTQRRKIAFAGVKINDTPPFQIPWDEFDVEPAFEELQETIRELIDSGEKFDLKFEIEWREGLMGEEMPEEEIVEGGPNEKGSTEDGVVRDERRDSVVVKVEEPQSPARSRSVTMQE